MCFLAFQKQCNEMPRKTPDHLILVLREVSVKCLVIVKRKITLITDITVLLSVINCSLSWMSFSVFISFRDYNIITFLHPPFPQSHLIEPSFISFNFMTSWFVKEKLTYTVFSKSCEAILVLEVKIIICIQL